MFRNILCIIVLLIFFLNPFLFWGGTASFTIPISSPQKTLTDTSICTPLLFLGSSRAYWSPDPAVLHTRPSGCSNYHPPFSLHSHIHNSSSSQLSSCSSPSHFLAAHLRPLTPSIMTHRVIRHSHCVAGPLTNHFIYSRKTQPDTQPWCIWAVFKAGVMCCRAGRLNGAP